LKNQKTKETFVSTLCDSIKNSEYCKYDSDQTENKANPEIKDQPVIGAIKESLRSSYKCQLPPNC
jgi:hypothetical protein